MIINFSIKSIDSNPKNFTNFFDRKLKTVSTNIIKKDYIKFLRNGNLEMSLNKKNNHIIFSKYLNEESTKNYYNSEWMKLKNQTKLSSKIKNFFFSKILNNFNKKVLNRKIRNYLKYLNNNSVILDIGCGNGELLSKLNICKHKFGSDLYKDKQLIQNEKTKYIFGDNEKLEKNIKANSLDLIIMHHSLEHIVDHDKIFKTINKLLKKDGILAITVPNNKNLNLIYAALFIPHIHNFSEKSLEDLLNSNGFNILENINDKYSLDEISIICQKNKIKKKFKSKNYKKFLNILVSNTLKKIKTSENTDYGQFILSSFPRYLKLKSDYLSRKIVLKYEKKKSKKIFINFNQSRNRSSFILK